MISLFRRKQLTPATTRPEFVYRDFRAESAHGNFGFYINRCNGRMMLLHRNGAPSFEIEQLRVLRDYMRNLLGHN